MAVSFSVGQIRRVADRLLAKTGVALFLLPLLFVTAWPSSSGAATLSPEVRKGLEWLQAQVRTDGTLAGEDNSAALPHQGRAEAVVTLARLASVPAKLAAAVAGNADETTEWHARRAIAAGAEDSNGAAIVTALLALQNPDGGFGSRFGYQSNALDTAMALLAFKSQQKYKDPSDSVARALAYLASARLPGAAWGVRDESQAYVTALTLLAGHGWRTANSVGAITLSARDWLLAARSGGNYGNTLDNAMGLLALSTQTADAAVLQPLVTALLASQGSEGSWAGDPFLTALALRALWGADNTVPPSTTGGFSGTAIDNATGAPIGGVAVQVTGLPGVSATTTADGGFSLSGIPAGTYTLNFAKAGYESASASWQIVVGQIVNLGAIRLMPAALTATVSGTVKNQANAPLLGAIVAVGTVSTSTDVKGAYILSGVPSGTASITVTLSGYTQAVSAPVAFEAGKVYNFSPTLYSGVPPATVLRGKVADSGTAAAVAGATVAWGGQTAVTAADGGFSFPGAAAGPFSLNIAASGYQGATVSGTLVAGVNDIGVVPLTRLAASSTLSGRITDAQSGAAIAGATISVQGLTATSAADGSYSLGGIAATSFDLLVSAAGYIASTRHVSLAQPGANTINVSMTKAQASGISIVSVTPSKPQYLPTETLEIDAQVRNTTAQATDAIVDALVLDETGHVALELKGNAHGLGDAPPNQPLTFPAASTSTVNLSQLLLRKPAGRYTVLVRAYDVGGRAISEAQGAFVIAAQPVLSGGVIVDPPLTQAGARTPVHFTGQLANLGNQPIPAGDLTLTVTLEHAEAQAAGRLRTDVRTLAANAPFNQVRGMATDADGNVYTVNSNYNDGRVFRIAPDGSVALAVQIPVGHPNYPQLSAVARDAAGNLWVTNASGGTLWKANPQGIIEKTTLSMLDSLAGIDVDASGNLLLTGKKGSENRLVRRAPTGVESVLWANGLVSPTAMVKDAAGDLIVTNNVDNTVVKVRPTGEILPFVAGLNRPAGITMDVSGNFYVANNGDGSVVKIAPDGTKSVYASGLSQPFDLRFDGSGQLFVSCQGDDSIRRIAANGAVTLFAKGVAHRPVAMTYDAAGNLYIANEDGTLRKLDSAGSAGEVATGLSAPRGLAIDSAGAVLVANYGNGTLAKVDGAGKTTLASGLGGPWGVAVGDGGNILVAEYGKNRLSRLDAGGALIERVSSLFSYPGAVMFDAAGKMVVVNNDSLTLLESGVGRVFHSAFGLRAIVPDPAGGAVFGIYGYDIYRIAYDGTANKLKSLPFYPYGIAADGAGNLLFGDSPGRKIYRMDSGGNLTMLAATPASPQFMTSDGQGKVYVLMSDYTLYSLAANGTLSPVSVFYTAPNYDYPSGLSIGRDGRPLVWTNTAKVIAVNPANGAQTVLKSGVTVYGATTDASGRLYATHYSDHDLVTYDAAGAEIARLSGFVSPKNIVWDGSQYWFVDSGRVYTLAAAAGSYPVKRGAGAIEGLAAASGGRLMAVYYGNVFRWETNKFTPVANIAGINRLIGIAARADGALSVADYTYSRIVTLDSAYSTIADHAGIVRPSGLAFDAAGRLHVASSTSGSIARFAANAAPGSAPSFFARAAAPDWLNFDSGGQLWAVGGSAVDRIDGSGVATRVSNTPSLAGIVFDGATPYAVSPVGNQVHRWDGRLWKPFAAGLASPQGVRALADGGVAVANNANGSLVKWLNGTLDILAGDLIYPHAVALTADGQGFYVGGEQGYIAKVDASGAVHNLDVGSLLNNAGVYGLAVRPDGKLAAATSNGASSSVYELSTTQPAAPPAPGTVVYRTTLPASAIPAGEGIVNVDFGSWIAPYGGDFKATVGRAGLSGEVSGQLHSGPFAEGALAAGTQKVGPKSQTVPMQLKITGADFSTVSRVETALVRPTVMGVRPQGMIADRAGNIYTTDANTLRKTTPAGDTSVVASGHAFGMGMAIDSRERLLIPVNAAGTYQLLRFDLGAQAAAQATVLVANLGGSPAGVAINRNDEIFVGLTGRLIKVAQDGTVSTVSTAGLPAPVGISIDGKDNIYVLNMSQMVSQIKPDGSAVVLYSKGDGVDDPQFEYEGMAMTADCAENLYLAPFSWKKVDQSGEEYTLVQVLARTGQAATVLDGRKIHYDLTDMDYIVFDRFGSRILIWTDYSAGRIWQVPVTCGAIGVEAHLVTKPGQTLTGMSRAPAAVVPLAGGGTEYVWSLRDVGAAGVTFGFDTLLENLALGETRPVIDSGYLLFKNSFAAGDVKVPLNVPTVQVDDIVAIGVGTDQPSYAAHGTAQVTARLTNANPAAVSGDLQVDVMDAAGVLVGHVTRQGVVLPPGGVLDVPGSFPIGTIVPGSYTAKAILLENGVVLAKASATFTVGGDNANAAVSSRLALDRAEYGVADRAAISSRVVSRSANVILESLMLSLTVKDPAGNIVYARNISIAQLTAGATLEFISRHAFTQASSGDYTVTQRVLDKNGALLDAQTATYRIQPGNVSGSGLLGEIKADAPLVQRGKPVKLQFKVRNRGNAVLDALPVTVRVIDAQSGLVQKEFKATVAIAQLADYLNHLDWNSAETVTAGPAQRNASAATPKDYVAVLLADIAGKEILLAQDTFSVASLAPFGFTPQTGVPLSSLRTSNTVTLDGLAGSETVTVTGGEYSLNGGAFTGAAGSVNNGDRLTVRQTASGQYSSKTTATLSVGGYSAPFDVTTLALACGQVSSYAFPERTAGPGARVTSNTIAIAGLGAGCNAPVSIAGGTYKVERSGVAITVGDQGYTDQPGSIQDGDRITLQATAPAQRRSTVSVVLTAGSASAAWRIVVPDLQNPAEIPTLSEWSLLLLALACALLGIAHVRRRRPAAPPWH